MRKLTKSVVAVMFALSASVLLASCGSRHHNDNEEGNDTSSSENVEAEEGYSSVPRVNENCNPYYLDEDEDCDEDEDNDLLHSSLLDDEENETDRRRSQDVTVRDMDTGRTYYFHTDELGYTDGHDTEGNHYSMYTDDLGYTRGHDSNGNSFSAHTNDLGTTTINTDHGTYTSRTNDLGTTTTYGPDGEVYTSQTYEW